MILSTAKPAASAMRLQFIRSIAVARVHCGVMSAHEPLVGGQSDHTVPARREHAARFTQRRYIILYLRVIEDFKAKN